VVSPASAAKVELVEAGCAWLRAFGYEPVVMPHALARGPMYYAGTAQERVADLHAAFADETIDGVICTRGGWGSAELLPMLDRELVRANPKVFVGYSDHTSLHAWFWNECGMATSYAPMVAADWAKVDGIDERSWRAAVEGDGLWNVGAADGLRVLREGEAEGRLLGGCLSILAEGLGTPWALRIEEPCVLFVEDIGTKPYQWDRMLQHLRFAGLMERVTGVVFGDMSASVEAKDVPLVEAACLHGLRDFEGPVMMGLRCGHVGEGNRSLPLGAWVRWEETDLLEVEMKGMR
jgi:muramoyltetrapeptide carboxypeptidase